MKIRNGFVSNSSSASFIIKWQVNNIDSISPAYALSILFDTVTFTTLPEDQLKDITPANNEFLTEKEKIVFTELLKCTKQIDATTFESIFDTNMYNSIIDFGEAAAYLITALHVNKHNVKLLDYKIENTE